MISRPTCSDYPSIFPSLAVDNGLSQVKQKQLEYMKAQTNKQMASDNLADPI